MNKDVITEILEKDYDLFTLHSENWECKDELNRLRDIIEEQYNEIIALNYEKSVLEDKMNDMDIDF